jgi:nitronate monooxygenase
MWPDSRLQELFGIGLPIIQAPMAGSSGLEMAVAVSEAGGLGSLACATLGAAGLREILLAARQKSRRPFNANFFAHDGADVDDQADSAWLRRLSRYFRELGAEPPKSLSSGSIQPFDDARCEVIEEIAPEVASFHFGLPDKNLVRRIKAAGVRIMSSATTVDEARWLVDHGCDAVIAQGYEAGGHRGMFLTDDIHTQMGTLSLVPQIADAVDVPVIAAGGIADGRGIAAAFALGASGVQIGTAYLFTEEAAVSDAYRDALRAAQSLHTSLTNVFSGRPTRCLVNRMTREIGPLADDAPAFPKGFSAMAPLRAKAEQQGSRDFSAHYCGQSASLGYSTSASQLTLDLAADALRRLNWIAQPASG